MIEKKYGQEINSLGGNDISHALPFSIENLRRYVERCVRELEPGGGYIMAPGEHFQVAIQSDNDVEFYIYAKIARKYSYTWMLSYLCSTTGEA